MAFEIRQLDHLCNSSRPRGKIIDVARTWSSDGITVDDLVHDPASAGGAYAGAGALAPAQQGIDDGLDQGLLDVLGRVDGEGFGPGVGGQFYRSEGEGGEGDSAFVADNFDPIPALVGGEIPDAGAERTACEGEAGGDGVFGRVETGLVGGVT